MFERYSTTGITWLSAQRCSAHNCPDDRETIIRECTAGNKGSGIWQTGLDIWLITLKFSLNLFPSTAVYRSKLHICYFISHLWWQGRCRMDENSGIEGTACPQHAKGNHALFPLRMP